MEPKQKQYPLVDVTGDRSKVLILILTLWNVRSMNQGKLEMVKQEMARVNINILEIIELKWTLEWVNLTQMTIISTTVGKNPLEEKEYPLIVNERVQNVVLGCSLKNDRMISVHFQNIPLSNPSLCPNQ